MLADPDHRCLSSAEVAPGVLKRCALSAGHDRPGAHPDAALHAWLEATTVTSRRPVVVRWAADKRVTVYELTPAAGAPLPECCPPCMHEEEPDPWRCESCGAPSWVPVSLNGGLTRIRQCVPCGHYGGPVPT